MKKLLFNLPKHQHDNIKTTTNEDVAPILKKMSDFPAIAMLSLHPGGDIT